MNAEVSMSILKAKPVWQYCAYAIINGCFKRIMNKIYNCHWHKLFKDILFKYFKNSKMNVRGNPDNQEWNDTDLHIY